jgi:hypothetical protein
MTASRKAALTVLALIALCFGGAAALSPFLDDPADTPKLASTDAPRPLLATPEQTTVSATPAGTRKATPSHTVKASPKPTRKVTKPAPRPTTRKPTPKPTHTTSTRKGVHPGAFCTPEGARGTTSAGTAMRCTRKTGEDRARWRKA